jgi:tRNA(adenine34) deaminase
LKEKWMQLALDLALEASTQGEVPVGAVLVCGEEVLAHGANRRERSGKVTAHAEIDALEAYSARTRQWRLPPGTQLYVSVEPCVMCTGALLWARVESVYYGCPDPKGAGLESLRPMIDVGKFDHRFGLVQGGVLGDLAADQMKHFFRERRKAAGTTPALL